MGTKERKAMIDVLSVLEVILPILPTLPELYKQLKADYEPTAEELEASRAKFKSSYEKLKERGIEMK